MHTRLLVWQQEVLVLNKVSQGALQPKPVQDLQAVSLVFTYRTQASAQEADYASRPVQCKRAILH